MPAAELTRTCRACPAWSIQEVVAHHVHAAGEYLGGTFPEEPYVAIIGGQSRRTAAAAARDAWIEDGVLARRDLDLAPYWGSGTPSSAEWTTGPRASASIW